MSRVLSRKKTISCRPNLFILEKKINQLFFFKKSLTKFKLDKTKVKFQKNKVSQNLIN